MCTGVASRNARVRGNNKITFRFNMTVETTRAHTDTRYTRLMRKAAKAKRIRRRRLIAIEKRTSACVAEKDIVQRRSRSGAMLRSPSAAIDYSASCHSHGFGFVNCLKKLTKKTLDQIINNLWGLRLDPLSVRISIIILTVLSFCSIDAFRSYFEFTRSFSHN